MKTSVNKGHEKIEQAWGFCGFSWIIDKRLNTRLHREQFVRHKYPLGLARSIDLAE